MAMEDETEKKADALGLHLYLDDEIWTLEREGVCIKTSWDLKEIDAFLDKYDE